MVGKTGSHNSYLSIEPGLDLSQSKNSTVKKVAGLPVPSMQCETALTRNWLQAPPGELAHLSRLVHPAERNIAAVARLVQAAAQGRGCQERQVVERLIAEQAGTDVPPPVMAVLDESIRLANVVLETFDAFDSKVTKVKGTISKRMY